MIDYLIKIFNIYKLYHIYIFKIKNKSKHFYKLLTSKIFEYLFKEFLYFFLKLFGPTLTFAMIFLLFLTTSIAEKCSTNTSHTITANLFYNPKLTFRTLFIFGTFHKLLKLNLAFIRDSNSLILLARYILMPFCSAF